MLAGQGGLLGFDLRQGVGDRVEDRGPVKPQPAASHRPKLAWAAMIRVATAGATVA
jgi:hypothetical protein